MTHPKKIRWQWIVLIAGLVVLTGLRVLFPGDIRFGPDEAQILSIASEQNAAGSMTMHGLQGTRGVAYGPIPILLYRLLLVVSRDLFTVVTLRILLVSLLTALSIFSIARTCEFLVPTLGLLGFASPYLWMYSRDLWDNSLNIAFTCAAMAAYLSFCKNHQMRSLFLAALFCTFALLTHLMALPFCAAIFLHCCIFSDKKWLRKNAYQLLMTAIACLIIASPYILHLYTRQFPHHTPTFAVSFFALTGWKFFSVDGLEYFLKHDWISAGPPMLQVFLLASTFISMPLFVLGLAMAVFTMLSSRRERTISMRVHSSLLTVLILSGHLLLTVTQDLTLHPHYHNAAWMAFFVCIWMAASAVWRWMPGKIIVVAYLASLTTSIIAILMQLHVFSGNREFHYGPTLENQIAIAQILNSYDHSIPVQMNADYYRNFSSPTDLLRKWYPSAIIPRSDIKSIEIDYATDDSRSGLVTVREVRGDT